MQKICYKCKHLIIEHATIKHGLHAECYKDLFDPTYDSFKLNDRDIEEFNRRGLLGSARVEWNQHEDLTDALVKRWKEITSTESQ
jgi:hypothetical protein